MTRAELAIIFNEHSGMDNHGLPLVSSDQRIPSLVVSLDAPSTANQNTNNPTNRGGKYCIPTKHLEGQQEKLPKMLEDSSMRYYIAVRSVSSGATLSVPWR